MFKKMDPDLDGSVTQESHRKSCRLKLNKKRHSGLSPPSSEVCKTHLLDQSPGGPGGYSSCAGASLWYERAGCSLSPVAEYVIFIDFSLSYRFSEDCQFSGGINMKYGCMLFSSNKIYQLCSVEPPFPLVSGLH